MATIPDPLLPLLSADDLDMKAHTLPFAEKLLGTSYELSCLNHDRSVSLVTAARSHNKANLSSPTTNRDLASSLSPPQPSVGNFQVTLRYMPSSQSLIYFPET